MIRALRSALAAIPHSVAWILLLDNRLTNLAAQALLVVEQVIRGPP